ncbi:MAG: rRNA (cytidine1920-2-O)/16S rRNA (cytidine1409-2-O)-methyltransferase [Actinomycetota bacterium]|nr:rRNA (cytidine1920-2-O)/16S rRNA (cytidine1409-2-O)-methyltransferase [Actinomycetota bacterium]
MRRRLDVELVRRGLAPSRTRAVDDIVAGRVCVSGALATTAARQVDAAEAIVVTEEADGPAFVSRGGIKLSGALDAFGVDVSGRRAVDVGSSTGGFTDCMLRRGAVHVVAIDVGRNQLAWTLRNDERVTVMERTNVRELAAGAIDPPADVCVADLSFISLRSVAPDLCGLTTASADFVLLVKPQFEAGRARVGKGGIVRDPIVHGSVLRDVVSGLDASGLGVRALAVSPLRGADGNIEFFAHARRDRAAVDDADIDRVVEAAHGVDA